MSTEPAAEISGSDTLIDSVEAELSMLWRRSRTVSNQFSKNLHSDLDPNAYGLLAILYRVGPSRLTELAATIGVGKPSISRQITFLHSLGLVTKSDDPTDGRAHRIELTDVGESAIRADQAARKRALDSLFSAWPTEDQREFARLLAKFNQMADQMTGAPVEDVT